MPELCVNAMIFYLLCFLPIACTGAAGPIGEPGPVVEPFDVQGHRGARGLLPENTLEAFERALELGASTLEMDLGVTADGVVVVSHDPFINGEICRHPDGRRIRGREPLIKDLPLTQVQAFDCGSLNPNRRQFPEPPRRNVPGARIPTLAEVFELTERFGDHRVQFNIETKIHPQRPLTVSVESFVDAVVGVVRRHAMVERTILQSFDWRTLAPAKEREPTLRTAALLAPGTLEARNGGPSPWLNGLDLQAAGGTSLGLLRAVQRAENYIDIFSPHHTLVDPRSDHFLGSSVREIRAAGFPVIPWTLNDTRELERFLYLGVDGLITDYPDRLLEILRRRGISVL